MPKNTPAFILGIAVVLAVLTGGFCFEAAGDTCSYNCVTSLFTHWEGGIYFPITMPDDLTGMGYCQEFSISFDGLDGGDSDCVRTTGTCLGGKIAIDASSNADEHPDECDQPQQYVWTFTPAALISYGSYSQTFDYQSTANLRTPLPWFTDSFTVSVEREEVTLVDEGVKKSGTMTIFKGICGSGIYGLNVDRSTLNSGGGSYNRFTRSITRAIGWYESQWRQFVCDDGLTTGDQSLGTTGLMGIRNGHQGENRGSCAPIAAGRQCKVSDAAPGHVGYIGSEDCNIKCGEGIYQYCETLATAELPSNATAEQKKKEALAKYYYGYLGQYWNRSAFPNFVPLIDNVGVVYANTVVQIEANQPWLGNLTCPCS